MTIVIEIITSRECSGLVFFSAEHVFLNSLGYTENGKGSSTASWRSRERLFPFPVHFPIPLKHWLSHDRTGEGTGRRGEEKGISTSP